MSNTSKGIVQDRLVGIFGSKYLVATTVHTSLNAYAFIVQEDTVISLIAGGSASTAAVDIDYLTTQSLSGVTLKQGALITAPQGELFQNITITSGSVIAYK
jgi:hypothetical protein|tara:strand:+ start:1226 stop:1528 length:303 start_codon:yes stop_codon:yes gene_type:complete